jgi:hypothetical protein
MAEAATQTVETSAETTERKVEGPASNGNGSAPQDSKKESASAPVAGSPECRKESAAAARKDARITLENADGVFHEAGPLFISFESPVENGCGLSLGVVTRDEENKTVQRSGIGVYAFSDHLADKRYPEGNALRRAK